MNNPAIFEKGLTAQLNSKIEKEVENIRAIQDFQLPKSDAPIVDFCVRKIEGTYDTKRAKKDTDNAIDLLYIAYNTTPQQEGDIRVQINTIMDELIDAQQKSESTMTEAIREATNIINELEDYFPDWLDCKNTNDPEKLKTFVSSDLCETAENIKDKATVIKTSLDQIAETYDAIIKKTVAATSQSEKALSGRLSQKETIKKEIAEVNAEQERLESLVTDLQAQVAKYDEMAHELKKQAETTEKRAFVLSILQVGTQVISAALPTVALAAAGPASILGAATLNTANQANQTQGGSTSSSSTDETIEIKEKLSKKQAELKKTEDKQKEIQAQIEVLKKEKEKSQAAKEDVSEIDKRIETAEKDLKEEKDNQSKIEDALKELNNTIRNIADKQEARANSLREMQMNMLKTVEKYENARREQASQLVKVKALLKGKLTQEETIKLTINSLNLSISALKRAKEIIEEISFFFKSFADYMNQIINEAEGQIKSIERTVKKETLGEHRIKRLIESTDAFFIKQTAEWYAVTVVSERFKSNFNDGWSKLNKLSGNYITGDKLAAYLETANHKLEEIVKERQEAADKKIFELGTYREQISSTAQSS